eukprot:9045103-Pyramimonas_sp.AAC.1
MTSPAVKLAHPKVFTVSPNGCAGGGVHHQESAAGVPREPAVHAGGVLAHQGARHHGRRKLRGGVRPGRKGGY